MQNLEVNQVKPDTPRLWTKNFLLLWQGQFISLTGDIFYQLALGFWVLAVTGSTAMMGALMAAGSIPRLVLSPFAGVLVDRSNRWLMMIFMDLIRGTAVIFIAVAGLFGFLEIWMVFTCGIIISLCASFFNPTIQSILPDIIPKEKLLQGNSAFSFIYSFSGVLGNFVGGVVYAIIGAPLMFMANGVSYIISAITEIFIKVPPVVHEKKEFRFGRDFKDGLSFLWRHKALKKLTFSFGFLNLFFVFATVLLVPFFERHELYGASHYGVSMAGLTIGGILGYVLLSAIKIKAGAKFRIFTLATLVFSVARTFVLIWDNLYSIYVCLFFIGFSLSVINPEFPGFL
jgi:MFS family permease